MEDSGENRCFFIVYYCQESLNTLNIIFYRCVNIKDCQVLNVLYMHAITITDMEYWL